MFYVIVYALMGLGAFGMIIVLGSKGFESDRLDDFRGLNDRSPWLAFLVLVLMLSMAGVPPFVGFWAKWSVLREVVAADQVWLATVAVVLAVIGLFYYLRVVRLVYLRGGAGRRPSRLRHRRQGHDQHQRAGHPRARSVSERSARTVRHRARLAGVSCRFAKRECEMLRPGAQTRSPTLIARPGARPGFPFDPELGAEQRDPPSTPC